MSTPPAPGARGGRTIPTIAFVTTCKGRLHHLKQTLPLMSGQRPDELIVVDYSCPDGAGDWVEANYPHAKVVRIAGEEGFNPSRARNAGAAAATSEWLFFVDADILVRPGLAAVLRAELEPGRFYRPLYVAGSNAGQAYGSFCVRAEDFAAVEGFDEVIEGWGYEDQDIYERLVLRVPQSQYSADLIDVIAHDDSERYVLADMRDRWHNEAVNGCYGQAKRLISLHRGGNGSLPIEDRRELMRHVRRIVGEWFTDGADKPFTARFTVTRHKAHRLASQLTVQAQTVVAVTLDPRRMHLGPAPQTPGDPSAAEPSDPP